MPMFGITPTIAAVSSAAGVKGPMDDIAKYSAIAGGPVGMASKATVGDGIGSAIKGDGAGVGKAVGTAAALAGTAATAGAAAPLLGAAAAAPTAAAAAPSLLSVAPTAVGVAAPQVAGLMPEDEQPFQAPQGGVFTSGPFNRRRFG